MAAKGGGRKRAARGAREPRGSEARWQRDMLEVAAGCLGVRVRILNRVVSAIYDEELRPTGAKMSQLNILTAIGLHGTPRPRDVSRALELEASTVSRNVERMRARGWLETIPGEDAREHRLQLTDAGRGLLADAMPGWRRAQARVEALLGAEGAAALRELAAAAQGASAAS